MKSIDKGYMSFASGFIVGPTMPEREGGFRQIDWELLKVFIEKNKEAFQSVEAGLAEDWGCTSGEVWNSDEGYITQNDTYVYASSRWATPAVSVTYKDGREETFEMWKQGEDSDSYFEGI
ncbi:hypothetical protein P9Y62_02865 [Bacillus thuringiensis]|uniref:Uncharacterized protein n=1 Tax=Bacillus thuringiensis HD-771 TaxID=1218175 RepID=A0A9W3NZD4_BACTU|nr:hypothetical protein [Bacillus thuringiensis]EEM37442.1 hypothetical protein bthur0004_67770 [Bacillus thuringiensis serovar sotto str. T04001]AFQ17975.1 hypothetical protein BTG_22815 [Bacillus thuringiensis HD-771]MEB4893472.1 hypothetical protein [Bacillus thuringiensis]MEC2469678.1 hypothetical protein [Bacillus thuringiensis]MEC2560754.1 hypothetical protein [Bacillus thuringiensis]